MMVQTKILLRRIEDRQFLIRWELKALQEEEKLLLEQLDFINREAFINRQID